MASKVCKAVVVSILILILLIVGVLCFALNQPRFVANTAFYFLKKNTSTINFKEITIENIKWKNWRDLNLYNVRVRCKINKDTYFLSTGDVDLKNLGALVSKTSLEINIKNLVIVSDMVNASNVNIKAQVYFNVFQFHTTEGLIYSSNLEIDQYDLKSFKTEFKGTLSYWELSNIWSQFYKGSIQGSLRMNLNPDMRYDFQAQLDQVDLEELSTANPSAFQNMKGKVNGTFLVKTTTKALDELKVDLKIPGGGYIPSNIMSALTRGVLPDGLLRQPLEKALADQESIPFVNTSIFIEMVGFEKYKAKVSILSPKASIDLRNTYDINMDGGPYEILSVLKLIHTN
jgi:hypothetical protein